MLLLLLLSKLIFLFSIFGILLIFLLNPLLIRVVSAIRGKKKVSTSAIHPSVSLITVIHNAENLVVEKIENSLSLKYPSNNYEIIIYSDGSTDATEEKVRQYTHSKIRFISSEVFEGKNSGLNKAMSEAIGDIIIFSDVDAILDTNAIINLIQYFADEEVGGICGQRVIYEKNIKLKDAQSDYIKFDSKIKSLESQLDSISSNDGKLYAIRRTLFQPIPPTVTDDLYLCLSVVRQHYRFLFEPGAKAFIRVPSRNAVHEVRRRRRIVSRSLKGIYIMREIMNPFTYGMFSIRLFVNKVMRRMLPLFLILIFLSSMVLSLHDPFVKIVLFFQIIFYTLAFSYGTFFYSIKGFSLVKRITSVAYYFCVGNYGTLMGLIDFLMGRQIAKWEPLKVDK
ncbi:MAG: hypothetical protein A2Y66_02210 [Nitrospirae bacterium RBG_13_41_22]|nr:MAG: hypothetical protein A2Y66_02210 [Nitrospirae bacterium RBG_13_41_22]